MRRNNNFTFQLIRFYFLFFFVGRLRSGVFGKGRLFLCVLGVIVVIAGDNGAALAQFSSSARRYIRSVVDAKSGGAMPSSRRRGGIRMRMNTRGK